MCIASVAHLAHPRWRLVVLANRDELHDRPADPLHEWPDGTLAGRDRLAGGTWLGVHPANRRLVLVTNHRSEGYPRPGMASRGALVTDLLGGADPDAVALDGYNPFQLMGLAGDRLVLLGNHPAQRRTLSPGLHGLSNGPFESPWPKVRALDAALARWLAGPADDTEALFALLADRRAFPPGPGEDAPDPRQGSVFIADALYGTRCSTLVLMDAGGSGRIIERRFDPSGDPTGESALAFGW